MTKIQKKDPADPQPDPSTIQNTQSENAQDYLPKDCPAFGLVVANIFNGDTPDITNKEFLINGEMLKLLGYTQEQLLKQILTSGIPPIFSKYSQKDIILAFVEMARIWCTDPSKRNNELYFDALLDGKDRKCISVKIGLRCHQITPTSSITIVRCITPDACETLTA